MDIAQLLVISILLPLIGAGLMPLLAKADRSYARGTALFFTIITLLVSYFVVRSFPANGQGAESFAVTNMSWFGDGSQMFDVRFHVGLDGLGLWLYGLSALLMVTAVLISWESVSDRPALFYGMLLLLEAGCLGVFAARDILLFYVFFEFTLIPLFFLIGIWGSEDRRYAAVKFFLFTLAGSVLTFLGLLAIVVWDYQHAGLGVMRFSIPELTESLGKHPLPYNWQLWIFGALFAGFAIKVPLFPFHTWLPLAHVQAPAAGSVILAGVLLKIGTYGFLRFSIPMLPEAAAASMPCILWLSVLGIVYGALVALAQSDMKRLIAYSSVSHLGFCMLGLFAFNKLGVEGGALQMINHGLSTGGLFAIIGMLYERYHTREINKLGGLARRLPWLAFFMLIFTFSSIGLPGLNGFAGEFLILIGMFQRAYAETPMLLKFSLMSVAVLSVSGVVLGAWYMLYLVQRVFFGPVKEESLTHDHHSDTTSKPAAGHSAASVAASHAASHASHSHGGHGSHGDDEDHNTSGILDLNLREFCSLVPLVVFVVWIGLQPDFFLKRMSPTLAKLTRSVESPLKERLKSEDSPATKVAAGAALTVEGDSQRVR